MAKVSSTSYQSTKVQYTQSSNVGGKNVGRVQYVVKEGKDRGTIYYKEYDLSKPIDNIEIPTNEKDLNEYLNRYKSAKPSNPNIKVYPLLGELVTLVELDNPISRQTTQKTSMYYTGIINLFNNSQHNAQFVNQPIILGNEFEQQNNIVNLKYFEGDIILDGRTNNAIRFASSLNKNNGYWSNSFNYGDPVLILSNGYNTDEANHVEDINKDDSTIVLTSTQTIPLETRITTSNPITKTILPKNYTQNAQIILNSDRIIINSKKDDVVLYSTTNTELYANDNVTLNANTAILLNSDKIILGTEKNSNQYPEQPAVLGIVLEDILQDMISALSSFGSSLTSVVTTPEGTDLVGVNIAGSRLSSDLSRILDKVENIKSNVVYIKNNIKE
jgi:hypothetical protein